MIEPLNLSNSYNEEKKEIPFPPNNSQPNEENKIQGVSNMDSLDFVSVFLKCNNFAANHKKNRNEIKKNIENEQKNMQTTQLLFNLHEINKKTNMAKRFYELIEETKTREKKARSIIRSLNSKIHTSQIKDSNLKGIKENFPEISVSIVEKVSEINEEEKKFTKVDSNEEKKGDFSILDPTVELKSKILQDDEMNEEIDKLENDENQQMLEKKDEETEDEEEEDLESMDQGTTEEDENVSERLYFETMNKFEFIFICISIPLVMLGVMNYIVQEDPTSLTYGQQYDSSIYKLFMMTSF